MKRLGRSFWGERMALVPCVRVPVVLPANKLRCIQVQYA